MPNTGLSLANDVGNVVSAPVEDNRSWWQKFTDGWHSFWNDGGAYVGDQWISNPWSDGSYVGSLGAGTGTEAGLLTPSPSIGSSDLSGADIPTSTNITSDTGSSESIDSALGDALQGGVSLSQYMSEHPGQSYEDYFKFMAENSDEWAEKYIDYMLEKQSIQEQNDYTASREDTAYQRLVEDLKAAGLNPAMMYGSSASPQAGGSVGVVKASEGANSRSIGNYNKLKLLLLGYMMFQVKTALGMTSSLGASMTSLLKALL